jgi:CO/xanthine dehydrogenase Mo-binding subunit
MENIGFRSTRCDALSKAQGKEAFAADVYPEGLLWAGSVRAGVPHGELIRVHTDTARNMDGVVAVLTRKDIDGSNRQGFIHWDMPVLCGTRVRHCGDALALVLAENRSVLSRAVAAVTADIRPLPVVDSLDAALSPGAPSIHGLETGNVLKSATITRGDAAAAMAACDVVISDTFFSPVQEHAFLETQNGVAHMDAAGIIHLTVSTQAPFRDRFEIARALGLDPLKIHVVNPFLGGGFGGKDGSTVQCLLALAAMHAKGRPVKMWWSREESILAGYKRHAARMKYRLGAKKDGTLTALECELDYDTGAYAHLGVEVMALGLEHASGPYRIDNLKAEGRCIYTNNPVAGAFRGFGVAQVSFAFEGMMDRLALALDMDPLVLRRKNALVRGDRNAVGVTMTHSTGMTECLDRLKEHDLWKTRKKWIRQAPMFTRRGVGIAAVFNAMGYGKGLPDASVAKVRLKRNGMIEVCSGVSDMGQGNSPTFVQMAGEILCQPGENMILVQPDTDITLPSGSASAGRTTFTYGNALIRACENLKEKLFSRAALMLMQENTDGFAMVSGGVRHLFSGNEVPLSRIAAMMSQEDRVSIAQYFMPCAREMPEGGKVFELGFPHLIFPFAAHLVRLEVDELTGAVRVDRYAAFTDAGRVLNPGTLEQQIQGAVAQGLGYALFEELKTTQARLETRDLSTYILPSSRDLPDIDAVSIETLEHEGPFGMKGAGEIGLNGPLPAVASALMSAGLPMTRAPFTPERVLSALESLKERP